MICSKCGGKIQVKDSCQFCYDNKVIIYRKRVCIKCDNTQKTEEVVVDAKTKDGYKHNNIGGAW